MQTIVTSRKTEVAIGGQLPTVLIGERINPTGKKRLAAALATGDLEPVRQEALAQVDAGADILDINVGVPGIDQVSLISDAVEMVMETVDVPLCLDSNDPNVLEAGLKVYKGKPLINSVNGEEKSLAEILPLVKAYKTAVIGLAMDERGIPNDAPTRLEIARKIVERAENIGIPREDIVIDCLVMTVGAEGDAGMTTLETIRSIRQELGVNMTLGASNISFGMPDRHLINDAFLAMAIQAGVTCPIVDAVKALPIVRSTDVILNRDQYARRYTAAFRQRQKAAQAD